MSNRPVPQGTRERLIERMRRQALSGSKYNLLTTGEVAMLFRVSHRAVRCWANAGKLPYIRTLGGHRRFIAKSVWEILERTMPQIAHSA